MEFGQAVLYGVTIVALVTTLILWIAQYRRMYGRKRDEHDDE